MLPDQKNTVRAYREKQKRKYDVITLSLMIALLIVLELLRR
jgi:hypothetical protein